MECTWSNSKSLKVFALRFSLLHNDPVPKKKSNKHPRFLEHDLLETRRSCPEENHDESRKADQQATIDWTR